MLLVLLYGLLKGSREIAKKKAMTKNSVMEVLVVYTILSFIFVIPQAPKAGGLEPKFYGFIAIKSFSIFVAWICSFHSLKKLPVSLYGILDLSRVLFATFLGVIVLGESLGGFQLAGLIIVCVGLLLLKFKPGFIKNHNIPSGTDPCESFPTDCSKNINSGFRCSLFHKLPKTNNIPSGTDSCESSPTDCSKNINSGFRCSLFHKLPKNHNTTFYVILALISCLLNAVSGFLDKVLMADITSAQLQFWYMLFLVIYYLIYIVCTREKIRLSVFKNGWVWLLAIMFVIGDKALFIANGDPNSKITIMTLIKQSGCIVTILGGKFIFKEKNTGYRFFCASIIILGIVLGVIK